MRRKIKKLLYWIFHCLIMLELVLCGHPIQAASHTVGVSYPNGTDPYSRPWGVEFLDTSDHSDPQYANGKPHVAVYALITLDGQKVFCAQPFIPVLEGVQDYSVANQPAVEKERLAYISALGYGYNGDTSQAMDFATQIRIWQEIIPSISFDINAFPGHVTPGGQKTTIDPAIQAKINIINQRLAVLDSNVSFANQKVTLYGYGKENGVVLNDVNGVFRYYLEKNISGIHTQKQGNTLTIWAEKGDQTKTSLTYDALFTNSYKSADVVYYRSAASQDLVHIGHAKPKQMSLDIEVITGKVKIEKQDSQTGTAQGLGKLDKAVYELIRTDTNQSLGTLTWQADTNPRSNTIQDLPIMQRDRLTPVTYELKEIHAPKGYHLGQYEASTKSFQPSVQFQFVNGRTIEASKTAVCKDDVSEIQINKVNEDGIGIKGATLQLLDAESGKRVNFHYEDEDKKVWITDGNPLTVKGLEIGKEYILQEIHAPNGVKAADDVHFVVEENEKVQIVNMIDETKESEKPKISTTASVDGKKNVEPKGTITISDVVQYENLVSGRKYTLHGILMDKKTKQPLKIEGAQSELSFECKEKEGKITMDFPIDSKSLKGKDIVVYEYLYDENDNAVAKHEDIEDEGQTIHFSQDKTIRISTTAAINGSKRAPAGQCTITDTVHYQNLEKGRIYKLQGMIMDKKTGKKVTVDGSKAEKTFICQQPEADENLDFMINTSQLTGKDLVVFETLYDDSNKKIAEHKDLNDEGQTVHIDESVVASQWVSTGSHTHRTLYIVLTGFSILCLLAWILHNRESVD